MLLQGGLYSGTLRSRVSTDQHRMRFKGDGDFRSTEDQDAEELDGMYGDSPPVLPPDDVDSLATYTHKKHNIVNVKTLVNPVPKPNESIGQSAFFTASPAVVHFGGLVVGKVHEQIISVVNTSATAQRLYIYQPSDPAFKTEYEKNGSMAPGMSQKIKIKFTPKEYKYYHDYVRIQTEGGLYILVPLHAYPVLNKLEFPRNIVFSEAPLCEPQTRLLTLRCSIPVDFTFDIEVLRPHPYYAVSPTTGVIPANGSITVKVVFTPLTLGSCALSMRLHIGQFGWEPLDCDISGIGVSGLLESRALKDAERRLMDFIVEAGTGSNAKLGEQSSFRGNLKFKPGQSTISMKRSQLLEFEKTAQLDNKGASRASKTKFLLPAESKSHKNDPTSILLAKTYGSSDINQAIDKVLEGTHLLGSKVQSKDPHSMGIRAIDGVPKMEQQPVPSGPGAGNAFDAGAQWMIIEQGRTLEKLKASGNAVGVTNIAPDRHDQTIEGLRVPPNLDFFPAVNFVLTQEPGKLKPKDLKVAIENSRREKEQRAEEQAKIREDGGAAGQLDLRGVLADERLNLVEGDPFKRQLREMAFLADVDDLEKQDAEKEFRVSEEYLGSTPLTPEDVKLVYQHRAQSKNHKKRSEWRMSQSRQHTALCAPTHATMKAGASAAISREASQVLDPSFDANRNDIWSKRMNTLRKFLSLVSRWLVRRRLDTRMEKLMRSFEAAGMARPFEREQVLAHIEAENEASKANGPKSSLNDDKKKGGENNSNMMVTEYPSVASMVCDEANHVLARRESNEAIIQEKKMEFSNTMVRRVLFPKFAAEEASSRAAMPAPGVKEVPGFDDRTLYQLKVRPEYVSMGYDLHVPQRVPLSFPSTAGKDPRDGAFIEKFSRPAVDANLPYKELKQLTGDDDLVPLPESVKGAVQWLDTDAEENSAVDDEALLGDMPSFVSERVSWQSGEVDAFATPSEYLQVFKRPPKRCSMNPDWVLRPGGTITEELAYTHDPSLRTKWARSGGFTSANTYLLAAKESRDLSVAAAPGPTLVDYYMQDSDRHASGLHCFANDHTRNLDEEDRDVAPLQSGKAKEDCLTDSESDDEDAYSGDKPSLAKAREILWNTTADADGDAGATTGALDSPDGDATEAFGLEAEPELRERRLQVELLRDRKIIEMESNLKKATHSHMDDLTKRLVDISNACKDRAMALHVQLPFHQYEQELVESGVLQDHPELAMPQTSFVEDQDRLAAATGPLSPMNMSLASPTKAA